MKKVATSTAVAALAFVGLLGNGSIAFAEDRVDEFAVPIASESVTGDGRIFGDVIFGGEGSDTLKGEEDDLLGFDIIGGAVDVK